MKLCVEALDLTGKDTEKTSRRVKAILLNHNMECELPESSTEISETVYNHVWFSWRWNFTLFTASNAVEQVTDNTKSLPVGSKCSQIEDRKSL